MGSNQGLGETLEEAFDSGTLVHKNGGIICMCTPGKRYEQGWGPRSKAIAIAADSDED